MLRNTCHILIFASATLLAGCATTNWSEDNPCSANSKSDRCADFTKHIHEVAQEGTAEEGAVEAQYALGMMYKRGEGVPTDKRKAIHWLQKAAEQGNTRAQFNLGMMYKGGEGVDENKDKAMLWFEKAAEEGHEMAYLEAFKLDSCSTKESEIRRLALRDKQLEGEIYLQEKQIEINRLKASCKKGAICGYLKGRYQRSVIDYNSLVSQAQDLHRILGKMKLNYEEECYLSAATPPEHPGIAAQVFENTWRSVVMIEDADGQGSGVIIRPNLVATNCHVVESGNVVVYKPENQKINQNSSFSAKIIHRQDLHDFCILEVKGLWGIPATIRKYNTLKVGESVYALGAPRGLELSLSNGLISQLRTDGNTDFIQTDAAISPGSSGGGLFDTKGNLIGILTSKYADEDTEGIGFAIPADLALEF